MKETYVIDLENNSVKTVFNNMVAALRLMSKHGAVVVEFGVRNMQRTSQQNSYYWALIGLLSGHTGFQKEDMSEYIVLNMKLTRTSNVFGLQQEKARSTRTFNKEEMSMVIDEAIRLCVENSIDYPDATHYGYNYGK